MPLAERWGKRPSLDDTHVFVCGNPGMIESLVDLLASEGFTEHKKNAPGQIYVERYWPAVVFHSTLALWHHACFRLRTYQENGKKAPRAGVISVLKE